VIEQAVKDGATVFLNSHLLAETEKICDHVAVLSQGRVVKAGALDVLKRKDAYRARFQKAEGDVDKLKTLGFEMLEEREEERVYRFEGQSPASLSLALKNALESGLIVVEVTAELKDLETILKEAVRPAT
jgi:ABC-2 type transport system ATP-binding protein